MKHVSTITSFKTLVAAIMLFVLLIVANTSQAITLSFENITNNNSVQLSDQLSVETSMVGDGVAFTFYNDVGIGSSITDIYFDVGTNTTLFTDFSIMEQSAGVSFDLTPHPANLPAGETINFYSDFGGDSTTPTTANGIDSAGEYITFLASLGSAFSYTDAMRAIFDGSLRIGMHIQAIEGGGAEDSDSYVTTVPVPAAGILFATALFGIGVFGRRKTNKSSNNTMVGAFTRES